MKIIISNKITLSDLPNTLMAELRDRLSFVNPKYLELQKRGYWTGETPPMLKFYEIDNGSLVIPRGFIRQLLSLCRGFNVDYQIEDNRRVLDSVNLAGG